MGRSGSIGNSLSRFIIVISALGIGLRLVMKGIISPERLVIFLVVVVIAAVIDSTLVKALLALFAPGFFVLDYVNYDVRVLRSHRTSACAVGCPFCFLHHVWRLETAALVPCV